jgi:hypothetical protein
MAPFDLTIEVNHPYKGQFKSHDHFGPTKLRMPRYSANCIPFRWMLRKEAADIADQLELDYRVDLEERVDDLISKYTPNWVQERRNHLVLLDTFFSAIKPKQSLCFFYAKATPLTEDHRRVLVGVGRVNNVGEPTEYEYAAPGPIRSMLWERAIQHSIRPGFEDGFLFPYQRLYELAQEANFGGQFSELESFLALVADEHRESFSYTSEHVAHDVAISNLLTCSQALKHLEGVVPGEWDRQTRWIDDRLGELWSMRGPYPGLGSALTAFGVPHGSLLAMEIAREQDENQDPWPLVDQLFEDPTKFSFGERVRGVLSEAWKTLSDERRGLLRLIARLDITPDQARRMYHRQEREASGLTCSDSDLLGNPYLLYELDRDSEDPIDAETVDRGVFPDAIVLGKHPISPPSAMESELDPRRVRALTVSLLEGAAAQDGHSLLSKDDVIRDLRNLAIHPPCPVSDDIMPIVERSFPPVVSLAEMADASTAYQLGRLVSAGDLIRRTVERRIKGTAIGISADWATLLDAALNRPISDEAEAAARQEKVAALEQLANSRISVLIGSAGTGKTTLLSVLCNYPQISNAGVLLLAPTGKARVQMEKRTGVRAQTIAQFLRPSGRYRTNTQLYRTSDSDKLQGPKTVIIDECSMLTEEQLAATLDAFTGVERLILVGDPRQLPPIGTGRPFVDIVTKLAPEGIDAEFPRVGQGYCELTIPRRQAQRAESGSDDLLLAAWFSGQDPGAGADEIWDRVEKGLDSKNLAFVSWSDVEQLRALLIEIIGQELELDDATDESGFALKGLGGTESNGWIYFNESRGGTEGAALKAERWQVLSPLRSATPGTLDLNRLVQQQFRTETLNFAYKFPARIPRPAGPERIVYGDKVINVSNKSRTDVWPKDADALKYVANGEIGVAVGFFSRRPGAPPKKIQVEFSSQPGVAYGYWQSEFGDEGNAPLELAYVITIHKAQGSEFGKTILVLPNPCRLLSRELLYTAFTRQQERLVVLHQGDLTDLKKYASAAFSETASRLTNLFAAPSPVRVDDRFLEEALIHRTLGGELVRSKSEVIIANLLFERGIDYTYENRLLGPDGSVKYPDFTIDDAETGRRIYWEHLGLMNDVLYRQRWSKKLAWYRSHGILPLEDGGGPSGMLVVSEDSEKGGIDSKTLADLVDAAIAQ